MMRVVETGDEFNQSASNKERAASQYTTMRPIVTDRVASPVCRPVTIVSAAKTAELMQMPFGMWTWVGLRNHVDGGPEGVQFYGVTS